MTDTPKTEAGFSACNAPLGLPDKLRLAALRADMADCEVIQQGADELERMASFAMRDDIKTELAKMLRHAEIAQSLCSDPIEAMRAYCREIEQLGII